jgi:RNA recognition motif-containing protein
MLCGLKSIVFTICIILIFYSAYLTDYTTQLFEMTKLFVGGFPLDMKELELVQLISPYGTVNTIKIVRDKKTGKCKGYAFLEMADKIDAQNAIYALNGTPMKDKKLNLNIVEEAPPPPPPPQFSPPKTERQPAERFSMMVKRDENVKPKRPRKQF